ncbi:MAG: MFS transporter [Planctomycetota bacterium]|nr:MFS transporter [Planctomycetota bacterium]
MLSRVEPAITQPTGSFRRAQWRMLLATMLCYLFYYTGRQTMGFAIPGIEAELGLQKDDLGWLGTALLWTYALGQTINGNLADRLGGRRMMSLGAILSCGLNWAVSFGTGIGTLLVPWSLNGYVQAMGWAPGCKLVSNWWSRDERGMTFGLLVFAAGLASVLAYVTSLLVLDVFQLDWRWIFRIPVLLMLVGGVSYYLVARDAPDQLGFAPPDDAEADPVALAVAAEDSVWDRYRIVLSNWRIMVTGLAIGLQNSARYGLLIWVPVHFLGADYKAGGGRWISIVLPIGMACGALCSGWISDRLFGGRRGAVISLFMLSASGAAMGMYALPPGSPWGVVALFLCGFFAYPQAPFFALAPDLLGRRYAATGVGIINTCAYVVAGLSEPFIGWMMERFPVRRSITDAAGVATEMLVDNTAVVFPIVAGFCLASALVAQLIRR